MIRRLMIIAGRTVAPAGLAVAALLAVTLAPASPAGFALTMVALVVAWFLHQPRPLGAAVPVRVLLGAAALVSAGHQTTGPWWPTAAGGVVLLGLLLGEGLLRRGGRPWFQAANLAVPTRWAATAVENSTVWLVNSALIALFGLAALLGWPAWTVLPGSLAAAAVSAAAASDAALRWRNRHRDELSQLRHAVEAHRPRFLLYFSAPPGSDYQARMWLPHLSRLDLPYLVVLPEPHNLPTLAAATDAPVVAYRSFEALDALMVPSLRAACYVNNGMHNVHCVRYANLTHVQLYHGDSDKAVTASPVNALYDLIFVAGQAAIDRFASHGVDIPAEKFRIVGRPQVEGLRVSHRKISEVTDQVVLYAPTWVGAHADSNYCSLPIAEKIIGGLLERDVTVLFRPHPYTCRDQRSVELLRRVEQLLAQDRARTGRDHRWGEATAGKLTLFGCMNAAHAMVCDVSSVASDFLYTGKPFALTDMVGAEETFQASFPVAKAAYVLRPDASNLPEVLADLLTTDPAAAVRQELRAYYLGDFPAERYSDVFCTEARRAFVCAPPAPVPTAGATA